MKVSAFVHMYPPYHNAGAEHYLHTLLKYLHGKGLECEVFARDVKFQYEHEGITVYPRNQKRLIEFSDVVITHLDMTGEATNLCVKHKLPLFHIIHNSYHNPYIELSKLRGRSYCLYNSQWIADKKGYDVPSVVLHPPVDRNRVLTKPGDKITLLNINENKGGFELVWLAKMLPEYQFIGVKGSYDSNAHTGQVVQPLPNITYLDNTPDVRDIYSQTKILIMPSKYESYGLTAVEAGLSGIPVLHNDTPGLTESLAGAGVGVPLRDGMVTDMKAFGAELKKLMEDSDHYKAVSTRIRERCNEVLASQDAELNAVHELIVKQRKNPKELEQIGNMEAIAIKSFAARKVNRIVKAGERFTEEDWYVKQLEKLGFAQRVDPELEAEKQKAQKPEYKNKAEVPKKKAKRGRPKKDESTN